MRRKPYKPYTREFKLEAIRLAEAGDKTASQVARELGLRVNQIWKWKQQLESEADNRQRRHSTARATKSLGQTALRSLFRPIRRGYIRPGVYA